MSSLGGAEPPATEIRRLGCATGHQTQEDASPAPMAMAAIS
jgi:hypothetical protein